MRKNILFIIIVLVFIGLIAAVLLFQKDRSPTTEETDEARTAEMIEAAFVGQTSIRCSFEEDRAGESVVFVKDGYVRAETVTEYVQQNMIYRDDVFYLWEEGQNQGIIMSNIVDDQKGFGDIRELLHSQEATCQQESLADLLFDPPADVDFINFVNSVPSEPVQIDN